MLPGLRELVLELADWCPLRCRHCSSCSSPDSTDSLPGPLAQALIREAWELGAEQISFGGGEPTGAATFFEALAATEQAGLKAEVFTCGLVAASGGYAPFSAQFVGQFSNMRRLKLILSIHGATPETHDDLTDVRGSFRLLMESLSRAQAAGLHCEFNFVPMGPNVREFPAVVDLAAEHGVPKLSVLRFVAQGRGDVNRAELALSREEEEQFVGTLLRQRERGLVEIRTGSPFNGIVPGAFTPCRAGSQKLVVQANGNILPCEVFKHESRREWHLNVYHQSLRKALASRQLTILRKQLAVANCLCCPVHTADRSVRSRGSSHVVSEAAL